MMWEKDKKRMGQGLSYMIDSDTYEKHSCDEVYLYGFGISLRGYKELYR